MMNGIGALLRRSAQTRTKVHDTESKDRMEVVSLRVSYQGLTVIQMVMQLVLWLVLWLYSQLESTAWMAMLLQFVPACISFVVWGLIPTRDPSPLALKLRLLLLPCLWLDMLPLLSAFSLFCQLQLPTWPGFAVALGLSVLTWASIALGGHNGVAYGLSPLRWLLLIYFLSAFLLQGMPERSNLWPLWGPGPVPVLKAALAGVGGVWSVALLFALPKRAMNPIAPPARGKIFLWVTVPLALVVLWSVYQCALMPWLNMNELVYKEKMIVMYWFSGDLLLFTLVTVMFFVLMPAALTANASYATNFICEALPKVDKRLGAFVYILPAALCSFLGDDTLLDFLPSVLPYRLALSLAVGVATLIVERKRGQ